MGEDMRTLPASDLDLNLMLTDSVWGKSEVSSDLKDRVSRYYTQTDEEGNKIVTKESLWGLLSFYTRDVRLGNLSKMDNELQACRTYLNLAGDFLQNNCLEPFLICLSRAATILETSQSKGGFLRKTMNTLRQENIRQELDPPKKGLLGGSKKQNGGF